MRVTLREVLPARNAVSLLSGTVPLAWKSSETAYQRRSPASSRRSGKPSVINGKRPIRLAQFDPT